MAQAILHEALPLLHPHAVPAGLAERRLLERPGCHGDRLAPLHQPLDGVAPVVPEAAVRALERVAEDAREQSLVPQGVVDEVEAAPRQLVEGAAVPEAAV